MMEIYLVTCDDGAYGREVIAAFSKAMDALKYCRKNNGGFSKFSYEKIIVDEFVEKGN